eukprot:1081671-Pelagomonas_calceolata.AAC.3
MPLVMAFKACLPAQQRLEYIALGTPEILVPCLVMRQADGMKQMGEGHDTCRLKVHPGDPQVECNVCECINPAGNSMTSAFLRVGGKGISTSETIFF